MGSDHTIKSRDLGEFHVAGGSLHGALTHIWADNLYINIVFDFLELFQFISEVLKLLAFEDWPVLERELLIKPSNRLLQCAHQSFDQERPRAAEWVPKIQFTWTACSFKDPWLKNTGGRQGLIEHSPSYIGTVTMLVETFIRGRQEYFSVVFMDIHHYFGQSLEGSLFLGLVLQFCSDLIKLLKLFILLSYYNLILLLDCFYLVCWWPPFIVLL